MYCRFCGALISDDSMFCNQCGKNLTEDSRPEAEMPMVEMPAVETSIEETPAEVLPIEAAKKESVFKKFISLISSVCLLFMFLSPFQVTNTKGAINGFDVMFYTKIEKFWGSSAIVACIGAWVLFLAVIGAIVLSVLTAYKRNKYGEVSGILSKCDRIVRISSLVCSALYFLIGVLCISLCVTRFEPYTLAFFGIIIEAILWVVYDLYVKKEDGMSVKIIETAFSVGMTLAMVGVGMFFGILLLPLIVEGEIDLFVKQETATIVSIVCMLAGAVAIAPKLVYGLVQKGRASSTPKARKIIACILVAVCVGFSVWSFVDCSANKDGGSSGGTGTTNNSGGGSGLGSYDTTVSKYIGLSVSVTSTKTSGNYTYVYCKITNVSSMYGTATKYRYVQVKAVFKDRYGSIVDTNSTYAIDGTWLEPGETKTFYYMVRDTSVKTATLSIV